MHENVNIDQNVNVLATKMTKLYPKKRLHLNTAIRHVENDNC